MLPPPQNHPVSSGDDKRSNSFSNDTVDMSANSILEWFLSGPKAGSESDEFEEFYEVSAIRSLRSAIKPFQEDSIL